MGYNLGISRDESNPISLEEWIKAVQRIDGLRIATGNWTVRNPRTGAEVMILDTGGDVEIFFETEKQWVRVFRWCEDGASFTSRNVNMKDPADPVRNAAMKLAAVLSARVTDDEGEVYV